MTRSYETDLKSRMQSLSVRMKNLEAAQLNDWNQRRDDAALIDDVFDEQQPSEPVITNKKDLELVQEWVSYFAFRKKKKTKLANVIKDLSSKYNINVKREEDEV